MRKLREGGGGGGAECCQFFRLGKVGGVLTVDYQEVRGTAGSPWGSLWVALCCVPLREASCGSGEAVAAEHPLQTHTHTNTHSLLHIPARSCMKGEVIFSRGQYFCLFTGSHAALGKHHRTLQRFRFILFFTPPFLSNPLHLPLQPLLSPAHPPPRPAFLVCVVFPRHKHVQHHRGVATLRSSRGRRDLLRHRPEMSMTDGENETRDGGRKKILLQLVKSRRETQEELNNCCCSGPSNRCDTSVFVPGPSCLPALFCLALLRLHLGKKKKKVFSFHFSNSSQKNNETT